MKTALTLAFLALCSSAAFAQPHTVPTASSCLSVMNMAYNRTGQNTCSYPIEVVLKFSDGNSDLEMVPGFGRFNAGSLQVGYRAFTCPQPAYPTLNPNGVDEPSFNDTQYYCRQN